MDAVEWEMRRRLRGDSSVRLKRRFELDELGMVLSFFGRFARNLEIPLKIPPCFILGHRPSIT